jgi:hypothetical protein
VYHQFRRPPPGLIHIDVRIRVISDNGGGAVDHGAGHVCMEVERHYDRKVRPQNLAGPPEDMTFDVVLAFGSLRAVHGQ